MTEYKTGQRVKVEYEATVSIATGGTLQILPDHYAAGHSQMLALPLSAGLKVEVLNPSGWPPQVGDIWEADGREYYARANEYSQYEPGIQLLLVPESGEWTLPDNIKALNPALIRRRGQ